MRCLILGLPRVARSLTYIPALDPLTSTVLSLRPPQSISYTRPDVKASPPVMGVSLLRWNLDGTLLLVQHANAPCVLLIYGFPLERGAKDKGVTVLLMSRPVRDVEWHPLHPRRLGWVCGTGGLFSWSGDWVTEDEDGTEAVGGLAECIGIPNRSSAPFSVHLPSNADPRATDARQSPSMRRESLIRPMANQFF